jgi:hypothetical protein
LRPSLLLLLLVRPIGVAVPAYADEAVVIDTVPRIGMLYLGNTLVPPSVQPLSINPQRGETVRAEETVYTAPGERFVFWRWSDRVDQPERDVTAGERLLAIYRKQVEVRVIGASGSGWYFVGDEVVVRVPSTTLQLDEERRLIFDGWAGEELPPEPEVRFVAVRPVVIRALWVPEYLLRITGEDGSVGQGWYREGSKAIVHARPVTYVSDRERLVLSEVTPLTPNHVTCLNVGCSSFMVEMDRPATLALRHKRECRIAIETLEGYEERWEECGRQVVLKAPLQVSLSEDVRLRLEAWDIDGQIIEAPIAQVKLDKPIDVKAKYVTEYLVRIVTPFWSGSEWTQEGSRKLIRPPEAATSYILASYVFKGWRGYGYTDPLVITVNSPTTIYAEYALQPDYASIAILSASVSALVFVTKMPSLRVRRNKSGEPSS